MRLNHRQLYCLLRELPSMAILRIRAMMKVPKLGLPGTRRLFTFRGRDEPFDDLEKIASRKPIGSNRRICNPI